MFTDNTDNVYIGTVQTIRHKTIRHIMQISIASINQKILCGKDNLLDTKKKKKSRNKISKREACFIWKNYYILLKDIKEDLNKNRDIPCL